MDLNKKMSKHFQLWEFVTSQMAERNGIDNTPPEPVIDNLKKLCVTILEPARAALGPVRISSGYRCIGLNKAVGGAQTSAHLLGWAADVIPLKCSMLAFATWVVHNVQFDQVILEFGKPGFPAWIHVSADPKFRKQVFEIQTGTGYRPIKI